MTASSVVVCSGACNIFAAGNAGIAGLNRHWQQVDGTPVKETTTVFTAGSSAIKFSAAATRARLVHFPAASQTVAKARVAFRMSDATPASEVRLIYFDLNAGTSPRLRVTTGGALELATGTSQSSITLADNTWYLVDIEVDVSANPNVCKWRTWDATNGWVTRTNLSTAQAATSFADVQFGQTDATGPTSGLDIYMAELALFMGTTPGEYWDATARTLLVNRLLPNADGTHSFTAGDFGYNGAGANVATNATDVYTYVDDVDMTSQADFIRQKVIRATGYVEVAFADPPANHTPIAVAVTAAMHASSTGANQASIKASDDGFTSATALLTNDDVSDTTAHYRHLPMLTKPSGGAWTNSALAAMKARWGYSGDVTDIPYLDGISLEYLYELVTSVSANVGAAAATGAAQAAVPAVKPNAGLASATGTAYGASEAVKTNAGLAAATGTAYGLTANVQPNAGHASASAWASEGQGSDLDVAVPVAEGTVTASPLAAAAGGTLGQAQATGAAMDMVASTAATPTLGLASGTAAALPPSAAVASGIGAAAATGAALDQAPGIGVLMPLASPQASAVAFDMTTELVSGAFPGHASAAGTAYGLVAKVQPNVGHAAAVATVPQVTLAIAMYPGLASAIAAAYPAQVKVAVELGHVTVVGSTYQVNTNARVTPAGVLARLTPRAIPSATLTPRAQPSAEVTPR